MNNFVFNETNWTLKVPADKHDVCLDWLEKHGCKSPARYFSSENWVRFTLFNPPQRVVAALIKRYAPVTKEETVLFENQQLKAENEELKAKIQQLETEVAIPDTKSVISCPEAMKKVMMRQKRRAELLEMAKSHGYSLTVKEKPTKAELVDYLVYKLQQV